MSMRKPVVTACYRDSGVAAYRGNPLIEALPPVMTVERLAKTLRGSIPFDEADLLCSGPIRAHSISRIIDDFFCPLTAHVRLEEKLSLMIRGGYVGRNPSDGRLREHLQNGYERVLTGDLEAFRFSGARSTAQSMSVIGGSGNGKSTTINRILSSYPQVIYHQDLNLEQVVYLKIDCSHDGSLKGICQNFFRALDRALDTNYERRYGIRRHSVETMLATMAQIANAHALGVLVIDEIQHLNRSKSGGSEKMLNFFVTLVNTIGLPVVLVGTPKARDIFETDLRSARRGAGFGAIFWERMTKTESDGSPGEWNVLTDKLWKLQWLKNRDTALTQEIRDTWYDLSQGVLDTVVKLFVLAQLRAIATRLERITSGLLRQVYEDELRPVHPMLEALRSGDPDKIARYSDLALDGIDRRLIQLQAKISANQKSIEPEDQLAALVSDDEKRLFALLSAFGYESSLLLSVVKRAFSENPGAELQTLLPTVVEWLKEPAQRSGTNPGSKKPRINPVKSKDWHTLPAEDLRFLSSQSKDANSMHKALCQSGAVLDINGWLKRSVS